MYNIDKRNQMRPNATEDNIHSHNFPSGNLTVTWVLLIPDLFEKAVFLFKSFILLALGLNFCDSFPASLEVKYFKIRKLMWIGV